MTLDALHQEPDDRQPLLDCSDNIENAHDTHVTCRKIRKKGSSWMMVLSVAAALLLLVVHIIFVALLRKTTVTLEQLTLPDLCHVRAVSGMVMKVKNPSYCSPLVGPLRITFAKKNLDLLHIQINAFELQSGTTTMTLPLELEFLTSPETIYRLLLADGKNIDVHGQVPVLISCMLVPFTIHLDVSRLLSENLQSLVGTALPLEWRYNAMGPHLYGANAWGSGVVNGIKTELRHIVKQVLNTIALSHFHTETDKHEIFAYTNVSFEYFSRVLWNIPSLSVKIQSAERQTILVAGLKQFVLGSGQTFISAYTEVFKNQSEPLQAMLEAYLSGNDVALHVGGDNRDTDCYSLQVLNHVDVKIDIHAMIDNKPALVREYFIKSALKELDLKTHKCLLEFKVYIKINNPLPILFDLYEIELDLLYKKVLRKDSLKLKFLRHVKYIKHVSWASHEENSIVLDTTVHDFDTCMEIVELYLHNKLAFDIQHGRIFVGVVSGNFSIPFSVKDIHVHSS